MYPCGVNSVIRLTVSAQHVAMFTFLALDIHNMVAAIRSCPHYKDHLLISTRGPSSSNLNLVICGNDPPKRKVYPADVISITFFTDWDKWRGIGFRLLYSFHRQGQTPEQFPDGTWNCSVASWASVQGHFPCNLVTECVGGEDEKDCPYSSPLCVQGEFFLGHSCYTYVRAGAMTWTSASAQCQMSGRHLVSLNDVNEWRRVTQTLRRYGVAQVYTGLRSAPPVLPLM